MPGVESTLAPIVPPTSVSRRSSTTNSSVRSIPGWINAPPPPAPHGSRCRAPSHERGLRESLDHPQATRDAERLAGDVGGVVRGKEGDRGGDFFRLSQAP